MSRDSGAVYEGRASRTIVVIPSLRLSVAQWQAVCSFGILLSLETRRIDYAIVCIELSFLVGLSTEARETHSLSDGWVNVESLVVVHLVFSWCMPRTRCEKLDVVAAHQLCAKNGSGW